MRIKDVLHDIRNSYRRSLEKCSTQDHCENNSIITDQQVAGKKDIWDCAEQLLINKTILNEVKRNRRNL